MSLDPLLPFLTGDAAKRLVAHNYSLYGLAYEKYLGQLFSDFERDHPCWPQPLAQPRGNLRPTIYAMNSIQDPRSLDIGHSDVTDLYLGYPQPVFDLLGGPPDTWGTFCRTVGNGWGVEVKTKAISPREFQAILLNTSSAALKMGPAEAWLINSSTLGRPIKKLERRWADLYIHLFYIVDDDGFLWRGAFTPVIAQITPTFMIDALKVGSTRTLQKFVRQLEDWLEAESLGGGWSASDFRVVGIDRIALKVLDIIQAFWEPMFERKLELDRLKRNRVIRQLIKRLASTPRR